ncbi:MAG: DUF2004 domain-containing protein, partial [Chitinophagaceae bacterium]|nr:DUF2004 domain-containing protein [Chitinophagaceae bacterium]
MATYSLPYFGELDLTALDETYDGEVELNGVTISLDLNFNEKTAEVATMEAVKKFIANLAATDLQNKGYIREDFEEEEGEAVREFIEFHLEEVEDETINKLLDSVEGRDPEEQLLNVLHLVRVGIYPQEEDYFAICDYSIGEEVSQYLLVLIV